MFLEVLNLYADRTLFECDDGVSYSYAAALELSQQPAMHETHRQLVFCLCANSPDALLGYLSLMAVKAVPLLLSSNIPTKQLVFLIEKYRPSFVWLPTERINDLSNSQMLLQYHNYALVGLGGLDEGKVHNDLALLVGTSGSTGSPKLVRLSHSNILSNAQAISEYLKLNSDEVPITTLPPSYSFGFSIIHSHFILGCKIALTNKTFFDRGFWEFLKSVGASSLSGVPYHFEILNKLRFEKMELPSLRTLTQAGGRLNPEQIINFSNLSANRGMQFFVMYGQAEASPRMSYLSQEKTVVKPTSIGQAIPGGKFWIEDESGLLIKDDYVSGELLYHGNNVCMGYAESRQDLAKGDEFRGILRTGDLAYRDADGDYYIVGRLRRFLKLFGHKVNLQDIEDGLSSEGFLVACSGRDDQLDVYLCNGNIDAAKRIKAVIVSELRLTPSAIRIINVTDLPRNEAGKIKYAELSKFPVEVLA